MDNNGDPEVAIKYHAEKQIKLLSDFARYVKTEYDIKEDIDIILLGYYRSLVRD